MSTKDTSGPAFPVPIPAGHYWTGDAPNGMTKREYFAGLAMQGMLHKEYSAKPDADLQILAQQAFSVADAMLAEGDKQ